MSTFEQKINADLKAAMKAKDEAKKRAIRAIKAGILLAKTDGSGDELTDAKAIKMLTKMAKQRKDSLDIYTKQNREDLAVKEREELAVIQEYLPKAMTPEEIETGVKAIIEEVGASSMRDMGKVMGIATKRFAGKADGKAISALVKNLLK
jgi:uncharacterized protein YqeY